MIGLDERIWRDCDEVGETIFFTLDAAMKSIRSADDYMGVCFNAADGSKWVFAKRI